MAKPENDGETNEFDAAKKIVEILSPLEKAHQERVLRYVSESLGLKSTISAGSSPSSAIFSPTVSASPAGRVLDIRQFSNSKEPKTDQQFAAVVAYYYQFEAPPESRKDAINANDLANAARLVDRRRPSKYALYNAQAQGYLDAIGKGQFKLSTVGENLVAIGLGGEKNSLPGRVRKKYRATKPSRKKKPKKQ